MEKLDIWNCEIINGTIDLEMFAVGCKKLKYFKALIHDQYFKSIKVYINLTSCIRNKFLCFFKSLKYEYCFTKVEFFHISVELVRTGDENLLNIIKT